MNSFLNFVNSIALWFNSHFIKPIFGRTIVFEFIMLLVFIALIVSLIILCIKYIRLKNQNIEDRRLVRKLRAEIEELKSKNTNTKTRKSKKVKSTS